MAGNTNQIPKGGPTHVATATPTGLLSEAKTQLAEYAELKEKRDRIMGKAKDQCAELDTKMEELEGKLRGYAESEEGRQAFGGQKSLKLPEGTLQWKSQKKLVKDLEKFDEAGFIAILEKLAPATVSVTVNSTRLYQAWDHVGKLPIALRGVGVSVESEDKFYVVPK